jgi:hypothetical protein
MSTATTVPLSVAPEAASRIAELGLQDEFDQMLEHTRQVIPGLRSISVLLAPPYDTDDEPRVIIEPTMDDPHLVHDRTEREWGRWMVNTFSPDVGRHFCLLTVYGVADEG